MIYDHDVEIEVISRVMMVSSKRGCGVSVLWRRDMVQEDPRRLGKPLQKIINTSPSTKNIGSTSPARGGFQNLQIKVTTRSLTHTYKTTRWPPITNIFSIDIGEYIKSTT
jgi:hypothetical protein